MKFIKTILFSLCVFVTLTSHAQIQNFGQSITGPNSGTIKTELTKAYSNDLYLKDFAAPAVIIDANKAPYNCTPNNPSYDNSQGIERAIQAAVDYALANYGTAKVQFSEGQYYCTRSPQTTSYAGETGYYAQIPLPQNAKENAFVSITIEPKYGSSMASFHLNNVKGGVEFVSTLTGQSYNATHGWPSFFGFKDMKNMNYASLPGILSYLSINWNSVTFRVPQAHTFCIVNDFAAVHESFTNVRGITDFSLDWIATNVPTQPVPLGIFNFGPSTLNGGYDVFGKCFFLGLYSGIAIGEHMNAMGATIYSYSNYVGLKWSAPPDTGLRGYAHIANLGYVNVEGCAYTIAVTDRNGIASSSTNNSVPNQFGGLNILSLNTEEYINDWRTFVMHVSEPTSYYTGRIKYQRALYGYGVINTGIEYPLVTNGGTGLVWEDMGAFNPGAFTSTHSLAMGASNQSPTSRTTPKGLQFGSGASELPMSWEGWIYVTSFATQQPIATIVSSTQTTSYGVQLVVDTSGRLQYVLSTTTTAYLNGHTPALSLNTWYHVVWTYDGSRTAAGNKIYVNGVSQTITDLSAGSYTGKLAFDSNSRLRVGFDRGAAVATAMRIKSLRFYNAVLTQREVTENYGSGYPRDPYLLTSRNKFIDGFEFNNNVKSFNGTILVPSATPTYSTSVP